MSTVPENQTFKWMKIFQRQHSVRYVKMSLGVSPRSRSVLDLINLQYLVFVMRAFHTAHYQLYQGSGAVAYDLSNANPLFL